MDHLKRFERQVSFRTLACLLLPGLIGLITFLALQEYTNLEIILSLALVVTVYLLTVACCFVYLTPFLTEPIKNVWQAVWHISPNKESVPAPNLDNVRVGHELVNSLVLQIYNLVQIQGIQGENLPTETSRQAPSQAPILNPTIIDSIPSSLFFIGADKTIRDTNVLASRFLNKDKQQLIGKNIYDVLSMSFNGEDTLDSWLASVTTNKVSDTKSWQRVKVTTEENKETKFFDLSAAYSKDSPSGNEMVLAIYDKTETYHELDKSSNYVAVAVHELRTPLTLLRGYIEVFEDELGDQLSPDHKEFMRKMSASAQTLTAFVANILNVARIDEDQLTLNLRKSNWTQTLTDIVKDMELRASVRGKNIELQIAPDIPEVAIDKISMYEVVYNLIENAIKYSGQAPRIIVTSKLGKDGLIETEVQDFGAGIPASAMSGLFTRYYRSHRSKNAVAGSGIGLYLVKAIITAHGGNVWVRSKENEGSTFGFSLQRFDSVTSSADNNDGIERQASGWIKNHSLYRR